MSETEQAGMAKGRQFSMARLMVTIIVVIVVALVAFNIGKQNVPKPDTDLTMRIFRLGQPQPREIAMGLTDADNDLVADPPSDPAKWSDPKTLLFSIVASPESEAMEQDWKPLVKYLSKATGKPVQYVSFESSLDQLKAMREGRLHVTAINTGDVPEAVTSCGFVPVATPAEGDVAVGYMMKIIVPANSTITDPADLIGKEIAFTTYGSNSGRKAPMELLYNKYKLKPDADYLVVFSGGHEQSIEGIASGQYQAAAVASDLLDQAIANGVIKPSDFKTIYTSERFPSLAIGFVYNLKPELAQKARTALLDFKPQGTTVAGHLAKGVTGFSPVSYKDDWALVRRIDECYISTSPNKNDTGNN